MIKIGFSVALTLAATCLDAAGAPTTGVNRAWVSGHGTDVAGCSAPTNPCRRLQYVVTNVIAPGGEIDILDPAGYGAVTIPFGLHIVNDGVGVAGVQAGAGQTAITINAGPSGGVVLRGLTIEGNGIAANGIQFNSGAALYLDHSSVAEFTQYGISVTPNSSNDVAVLIFNSQVYANGGGQIYVKTTGSAPTHVRLNNAEVSGGATNPIIEIDSSANSAYVESIISNSFITGNPGAAIQVDAPSSGSATNVTINNTTIADTDNAVIANGANATIILNASTITQVGFVAAVSGGGSVKSFGNNGISFNQALGPISTMPTQ
jgi:hypothetical protein